MLNTPLKLAVEAAVSLSVGVPSVSASWVVSRMPVSVPAATSSVGPSSAKRMLPPRSMVALSVAVSPSPSVIVAEAVRFTRPVPRMANWSSNGAVVVLSSA